MNTAHPFLSPIAPDNLAGDPTAAGACHLVVDRPSQAPPAKLAHPRNPLPLPVPCHHSVDAKPGPRRRTAVEPHRRSNSGQFAPSNAIRSPPHWHVGPLPQRHPRSIPHWWADWAACPRARPPALGWAEIPPGLATRENPFLFPFFHLFFLFSCIYVYIDILCTKNSLNKL
jgi:hypothetical protein